MYIHILPQFIQEYTNEPELVSVSVPELNFSIYGNDLTTGHPYPNKNYHVGMSKNRKSLIGLLLKTDKSLTKFTTEYKWYIPEIGDLIHIVDNHIEDDTYDLVSQDTMLNIGFLDFEARIHNSYSGMAPVNITPTMRTRFKEELETDKPKRDSIEERIIKVGLYGYVNYRRDELYLHSIESDRLAKSFIFEGRYPLINKAIIV